MSQGGPLDDIHRKVSLRSCMSDDLRETLGFNTFRKERGTEEAALPWLQAQLKTGWLQKPIGCHVLCVTDLTSPPRGIGESGPRSSVEAGWAVLSRNRWDRSQVHCWGWVGIFLTGLRLSIPVCSKHTKSICCLQQIKKVNFLFLFKVYFLFC